MTLCKKNVHAYFQETTIIKNVDDDLELFMHERKTFVWMPTFEFRTHADRAIFSAFLLFANSFRSE